MQIQENIIIDENNKLILQEIILNLKDKKEAFDFIEPVDVEFYGLDDYYKMIKKPMCLNDVQSNLENGKYNNVNQCLDDLQLIWDNCLYYNTYYSKVFKLAMIMENYQKRLVEKHYPNIEYGKNNPSYEMIQKLKESIYYEKEQIKKNQFRPKENYCRLNAEHGGIKFNKNHFIYQIKSSKSLFRN